MISISGMSSFLALKLADRTEDFQKEQIRNSFQHSRAIEIFKERISDVETVDQLVEDNDLYTFVMRAFDLEDQIFGKALVKKALKSDKDDRESLINRLTDPRMREMFDVLGFTENGTKNLNTILTGWQTRLVERYIDTQFVNGLAEQNETVGAALQFRRKAADIESPFDILKDTDLSKFVRTVLGLPAESAQMDIDRQATFLEARLDFDKLQDPAEVEAMITRFSIVSDALNSTAALNNVVVQMMSSAVSAGSGDSFTPITIDITSISLMRSTY
ncbi:DUF1217 domain-containing protein [Seohaeicola zhoushanensis]|uniref:DUF1217 domain-containing protein n=1 Tax=Seohaeicola zhoushanensis TaxID=1569283 RepID=A0A8J3M5G0_9RHOB|nr:DUF1217 domain-containing protein [Seohaeicola zhoushanensis]GHF36320.1 hypothetical protein GCM10017056_05180 [Seohaeicola zhoushanensis]